MADLNTIDQVAASNDRLMFGWINSARQAIIDLKNSVATLNQQLNDINEKIVNAFKITSLGGLTVSVAGNTIKNGNTVSVVQAAQLTLLNNTTNYIYVDGTGVIKTGVSKPTTLFDIGYVVTLNNAITQIVNYPVFAIEAAPNFENYASIEYVNSRNWQLLATGKKINNQAIPLRDTYYTISYAEITGSGLNTNGLFTVPKDGKYMVNMITRVDTTTPISSPNLSTKMSFFVNNIQEELLMQAESARGDTTLNGSNAIPLNLKAGDVIRPTIYITEGSNVRVREITNISFWLIP